MPPSLVYETIHWQQNSSIIVGADEVGRGSLAGPLTVAAVVFSPDHQPIKGVTDSKLLTPNHREKLCSLIKSLSMYWSISHTPVSYINSHGISSAITQALDISLSQLPRPDHLLFDGRHRPKLASIPPNQITTITKGDQLCYSIAAASIIAKVTRDQLMRQLHTQFPHYDWCHNKGYGTRTHRQAILTHGPTVHHRTLFIRKTLSQH